MIKCMTSCHSRTQSRLSVEANTRIKKVLVSLSWVREKDTYTIIHSLTHPCVHAFVHDACAHSVFLFWWPWAMVRADERTESWTQPLGAEYVGASPTSDWVFMLPCSPNRCFLPFFPPKCSTEVPLSPASEAHLNLWWILIALEPAMEILIL